MGKGEWAILSGASSSTNQWMAAIQTRIAEKYPALKLAAIRPSEDDRDRAFREAQAVFEGASSRPLVRLEMPDLFFSGTSLLKLPGGCTKINR